MVDRLIDRKTEFQDHEGLIGALRDVRLNGDPTLKPYQNAEIQIVPYHVNDLRPTAYYALEDRILALHSVYEDVVRWKGISIFHLYGLYHLPDGVVMAPPIVERYYEPREGKEVSAIVDGLHRLKLARDLQIRNVLVVEVSGIDPSFPLVPLPLSWSSVSVTKEVPARKREYRITDLQSAIRQGYGHPLMTKENASYFYYRDLSALGSTGIRPNGHNPQS